MHPLSTVQLLTCLCTFSHLCVGFLFLVLYPAAFSSSSSRRLPHTPLTPPVITHTTCHHTICYDDNLLTHNSTHTQLAHIQLNSDNLLTHNSTHTQLVHISHTTCINLSSHIQLVIIQLAHTQLNSHTTCSHATQLTQLAITQLAHTQLALLIHYSYTHTHTRVITQLVHTQLVHTQLPHTQLVHAQLAHTQLVLRDIHLRFTWQAWHLVTSTFVSRGRRGTYGTGLAHPLSLCVAGVALTALCVAGLALGDIHLHSAWPACTWWQSTVTLRGRCDTCWHLWRWPGSI